jgi:hypothetical protein
MTPAVRPLHHLEHYSVPELETSASARETTAPITALIAGT